MTRGCVICQASPAKKSVCCGQRLCAGCADSVMNHDCPRAKELDAIASDPKKLKAWREANAGEERLTTEVIDALNRVPGILVWRTKRRQGAHRSDELDGVLDVGGLASPDGRAIYVETKNVDPDGCPCKSCENQRAFAERVRAFGGIAVLGVRKVADAIAGVRMGLARARGLPRVVESAEDAAAAEG